MIFVVLDIVLWILMLYAISPALRDTLAAHLICSWPSLQAERSLQLMNMKTHTPWE